MTGRELKTWREGYPRSPRLQGSRGPRPPGLTQKEAAKKLGISEKQYQRWETGKADIPERTAKLVDLLAKEAGQE